MKKLLGILLAALLLLGLLPVTALAEPSSAISVSNSTELGDAITNIADGGTITLIDSFDTEDTGYIIPVDKTIILNLNGKTITTTADPFLTVAAGATLTINDTVGGGGLHETRDYSYLILNSGTLIINAGTFTSESEEYYWGCDKYYGGEYAVAMSANSATTINGGTFNGTFYTNGSKSGQTLTINGGTFHKMFYLASANETITINDGTFDLNGEQQFEPNAIIEIKAGTLDIYGGTFELDIDTTGNDSAVAGGNGSGAFTGVIIACKPSTSQTGSYGSAAIVNINDGVFENNDGDCIVAVDQTATGNVGGGTASFDISDGRFIGVLAVYDTSTNEVNEPSITVTGGYYTENPEEFLPENGEYWVRPTYGTYSFKVMPTSAQNDDDDDDDEDEGPIVSGSNAESERLNKATEEYQTLKSFAVSTGFKTGDIIASWDIDLDGKGPWKLTFELGKEYAGETVTIYHLKKNGDVETFVVTANKYGDAKITVDSASPFMVVYGKATTSASVETVQEENPNTGVSDAAALVSALAVISLIAGAAAAFKK
ncbi:MAG TPA: hypothetical protein PKY19_06935 [Oscillospiraceae bacterium]|nr:hypothetical protein [Oscillospiraceae bacterium]HXK78197.1 hypothetical protein [Oscillospiraceae bacterium]